MSKDLEGEAFSATEKGGHVVAKPERSKTVHATESEENFLARGVREGWLTPARIRDGNPPPADKPIMTLEQLLEELDRDRED